jgi:hypothetical protein
MQKVLMGVLLAISFNCIYAAETSTSNIDSEWIYNYSSDTNKKYGVVTFTVVKNELGGLVEKVNFDTKKMPMISDVFQFERDLPLGNIVVDFINPFFATLIIPSIVVIIISAVWICSKINIILHKR